MVARPAGREGWGDWRRGVGGGGGGDVSVVEWPRQFARVGACVRRRVRGGHLRCASRAALKRRFRRWRGAQLAQERAARLDGLSPSDGGGRADA